MPYRCKDCYKDFSVKTDTLFQESKLSYHKCLLSIHLLTTSREGLSSYELAEHLDCTQKTAWYLCRKIKECMEHTSYHQLELFAISCDNRHNDST